MYTIVTVIHDIVLLLFLWSFFAYVLMVCFWPGDRASGDITLPDYAELERRAALARQGQTEPHEQVMARLRDGPENRS